MFILATEHTNEGGEFNEEDRVELRDVKEEWVE